MDTDLAPTSFIHPLDNSNIKSTVSEDEEEGQVIQKDMGSEIHKTRPDETRRGMPSRKDTTSLPTIEYARTNPLPRQSTCNSDILASYVPTNLGQLDTSELNILQEDIKARKARRASRRKPDDDEDDRILIGTRVSEGHTNYQLMYDMLTGIRIAVGRVSAKIEKKLVKEDFSAAHKLVFDVTGNELTPGVKYDFKFKDYAPWVFRYLREKFHIDAADYMMSLTNKYILSELGSPGKSGSFLYYSRDYRFIIKTIHHSEHKFMRRILNEYYDHVCENPNTLLCRFYGLHRIKLPTGSKIHFVVMGNVFPANKDIHESFDLKGSTYGRATSPEEIERNPQAVLKDINWIEKGRKLEFGTWKRAVFFNQLHKDVQLLMRLHIMDYSLLVGIHDMRRGNTEGIRDNQLQFIQPLERSLTKKERKESGADIVKKAIRNVNPVQLDSSMLPDNPLDERRYCIFYSEDGGYQSTDDNDQPTDKIYFMGVIDILTKYNIVKKTEHFWKSLKGHKDSISAVNPVAYGERFIRFMEEVVVREPNQR